MMLEELFKSYKELTINIISGVKIDLTVDEFLEKRQSVIDEIADLAVSGEDKKKAYLSLGLDVLDKELENVLKQELAYVKQDIKKNVDSKKIYSGYVSKNISGNYIRKTI